MSENKESAKNPKKKLSKKSKEKLSAKATKNLPQGFVIDKPEKKPPVEKVSENFLPEYSKGILPPDHELAAFATQVFRNQWALCNNLPDDQLISHRELFEESPVLKRFIASNTNRRLYSVLKPTRDENIQRIMYLIGCWILRITELSDSGHISTELATAAIGGIGYGDTLASALLFFCECSYKGF